MVDVEALARTLVRRWRGDRTQLELSVELGYNSNVVGHWETGRSSCSLSHALRLSHPARQDDFRNLRDFIHQEWVETTPLHSREGVRLFLNTLMVGTDVSAVTRRTALSRHKVQRWLRGETQPTLVEFLEFLLAIRLIWVIVPLLSDDVVLESDIPDDVTMEQSEVLFALDTTTYRQAAGHDLVRLSQLVGLDEDTVQSHLLTLRGLGTIAWDGERWTLRPEQLLYNKRKYSIQHHLADRLVRHEPYWIDGSVGAFGQRDLEKVQEILRKAKREIFELAASSDEGGDAVYWITMAISPLAEPPAES